MSKTNSLEDQLTLVRALRQRADATPAEVAGLLNSKHSLVAASGAEMTAAGRHDGLIPDLVKAFERFMQNPEKTDRGCTAKLAIINALCALDHRDFDIYRSGISHIQKEPSYGGPVDTAGEMRGRCAVALAECGAPGAVLNIVQLLVDEVGQARVGAARAIGALGSEEAAAILRLKLLTGDDEPVVLAECCLSLLQISVPEQSGFVVAFLAADDDATSDLAAALMESRASGLLPFFKQLYPALESATARKAILQMLSVVRIDGAMDYLLELLEKQMHARAKEVLEALKSRRGDERLRGRVRAILEKRGDPVLLKMFAQYFDV